MEVRQQRERSCRVFLSCENQIFLKLPQQWLTEKAATAMTGQGHDVCTHNLIHHRVLDTISINLSSVCPPPHKKKGKKKQYFYSITSDWTRSATQWPMGRTRKLLRLQKSFHMNTNTKQNTCTLDGVPEVPITWNVNAISAEILLTLDLHRDTIKLSPLFFFFFTFYCMTLTTTFHP